jgi:hypothetical protein
MPLESRTDDHGNVAYFTYQEGKKVMFLADTSTGVTAYLPDGSTVNSSEGALKDPNARPNRMAASAPFSEILEGSLDFNIQTGVLTAKNSEGEEVKWNGMEFVKVELAPLKSPRN